MNQKSHIKIQFPINYSNDQFSQAEFKKAVKKLQAKFSITKEKATELTEDIIKCLIHENKPPDAINHEIESLCCPFWTFLRNKSIPETIEFYKR